ncbi:MAG: hypothetical protein CSA52_01875 [Gammaproteobacteria bacterium]|nr:MAG: hypothetical protein CSB48_12685 [Pseudomonadota bacterium]PIE38553.1 MAG: hypothetical protein CSA52_01875 [Gammaproteobacteria bacterium]
MTGSMTGREDALADIVDIAKRHNLGIDDIAQALTGSTSPDPAARSSGVLARVLAFLGSIFVLAGVGLFIGVLWDDFNPATRVLVTLGAGFAVFLFALTTMTDVRFARVTTPLLLVSALLQPMGILVMLAEYSDYGKAEHAILFVCVVMFIQQFFIFLARREYTVLLFTSLFFGAAGFGTFCDIIDIEGNLIFMASGLSLMCLSYVIDKSIHKAITPFWYLVGSIFFLSGVFDLIEHSVFEILFLGFSAGIMYLATVVRSRTLLFVSVLSMISFIGYYFQGVLSSAYGLILMGVLLIGLSALAMQLSRKYIQN